MTTTAVARCDFSDLLTDGCAHCRTSPTTDQGPAMLLIPTNYAPDTHTPADTWRDFAACRETDPDLWFPESGNSNAARAAKRICARCPVIADCREFIEQVETHYPFGIWGGTTAEERRPTRRRTRKKTGTDAA
ncbi:MAG TPA: WhiB family transcriptional regulator [Streptomyces sp.]|nr:WhiB family transcriptional regulator [Streptomyces sp.]